MCLLHPQKICKNAQTFPSVTQKRTRSNPDTLNSKNPDEARLQEKMIEKLQLRGFFFRNLQIFKCHGKLKILSGTTSTDKSTHKEYNPCTDSLCFVLKHELWCNSKSCQFFKKRQCNFKLWIIFIHYMRTRESFIYFSKNKNLSETSPILHENQ